MGYRLHHFSTGVIKSFAWCIKNDCINKDYIWMDLFITLFEIFIFGPKIQLSFPEKIVDFFGWKTRENVVVLDFLAVDNFDFTRKIVKKKILVKNSWKCWGFGQNWIFGQKFDFSNSVLWQSGGDFLFPLLF